MKNGDEDEDMDVVVAQQVIGDPSLPGDGCYYHLGSI